MTTQTDTSTSNSIETPPASRSVVGLPGFEHRYETIKGVRMHYVIGGNVDGDTVLLLAGYPESWYAWHKVIPLLAGRYRIIAPDLPGQGDSDRPLDGYDTQTLATFAHDLMTRLGVGEHFVAAHDVGAWVGYPYAALFGQDVMKLVLMDAGIPGITLPDALPLAPDRSWRTWHFAFHMLPDLPEVLITGHEREYLDWFLRRKAADPSSFSDADVDEYVRIFKKAGGLRAGLAYYRATPLSAQQNSELCAKGKLTMPVLALSADQGTIPDMAGPLRAYANDVRGATLAHCGHFLPEEQPVAVAEQLSGFFQR
jgi:pimeloyl-ACP methyl ester carboxylesterase